MTTEYQSGIKEVKLGQRVKIVHPVNLYGCTLEDECFVGPFVEIQKNVKIGKRTKIQSHTFICELVRIGDDCFIGHGVMFVNDTFATGGPAMGNKSQWLATVIGNNVSIGSNVTIMPVVICEGSVVGAGSVVTKNLLVKGVYAGNPARLLRKL